MCQIARARCSTTPCNTPPAHRIKRLYFFSLSLAFREWSRICKKRRPIPARNGQHYNTTRLSKFSCLLFLSCYLAVEFNVALATEQQQRSKKKTCVFQAVKNCTILVCIAQNAPSRPEKMRFSHCCEASVDKKKDFPWFERQAIGDFTFMYERRMSWRMD